MSIATLRKLCAHKQHATGIEHVVCLRAGHPTVQSLRVATFAKYTII